MRLGWNPSFERRGRRLMTAAPALAGIFLIAAAAVVGARPSEGAYLDRQAQMQRMLPVPRAQRPLIADRWMLSAATSATPTAEPRRRKPKAPRVWKQMPAPVRIVIPAIGVSAPMIRLGRNSDGTAEVPRSFADAGWFEPGPEPGEKGAAVILGHVDSRRGPGVFYRLPALRRGDRIKVVLRNRKTLQFIVTGTMQASKHRFPTKLVYKRTPGSTLRIITCGGRFDTSTGHYVDNYIVFAWLVGRP
jgi:sortase (surface protein transpeptidase)